MGQAEGLVQQDHSGLGIGADLRGGGPQGVGSLQGVPPLDAPAATGATADVDVELADEGTARDLRLILWGHLSFPNRATAPRASLRQGGLQDFINRRRAGGQAVAMAPVGRAGFPPGRLGMGLGRPLGEGSGLALDWRWAWSRFVRASSSSRRSRSFSRRSWSTWARSCCNSSRTETGTDTGSNTLMDAITASSLNIRLNRYTCESPAEKARGANQAL